MLVKKDLVLRAAIAACFGMLGSEAFALDLTVTPFTGAPSRFAKEIPANTAAIANPGYNAAFGGLLDVKVPVPAGYAIASASPLFIKFALTNGAKFLLVPNLYCSSAGGVNSAVANITVGGAGQSNVTFQVPSGSTTTGSCQMSAGSGMTISGLGDVTISAQIEYNNGLSPVVSAGGTTLFVTYVRGMTATVSGNGVTLTVDATSGSDNWATTSTLGSTTLGKLGGIRYTQVGTSAQTAGAAGNVAVADAITTAAVTVSGPAIGVALATLGNSGVFLDKTDATCATKDYLVAASASNAVTFNVTPADIDAGVTACINISGATPLGSVGAGVAIPLGQITATLASATAVANVTPDLSGSSGNNLVSVGQNGTTKTAWLINASTSTAKTTVLRIVNNGTADAAFTATARNTDVGLGDGNPNAGTTLGTANSPLGTIVAGGAMNLTSAQLESKLGIAAGSLAAGAKYRVTISAGTTDFQVLNFTRDLTTGSISLSQTGQ